MRLLAARSHFQALSELTGLLTRHRELTWELTKREITDRYTGQVLGYLWAIGHPLVLMGIYIFIFAFVFKLKVGGTRELPLDFTTYLLAGLIPWMAFQEAMSKGAVVITGSASLVQQVVFPIEVLPIKGILVSLVTQLIASIILITYVLICNGDLPWTYALLPVLWVIQFLAMAGVCYLLASIGVYFRDVKDFVQVFCVAGMYTMPIFYLPESVPDLFKPILYLNPFSYLIWCYQDVCYFGRFEHPWAWLVFPLGSVVLLCGGYQVFRRLKIGFGSVL